MRSDQYITQQKKKNILFICIICLLCFTGCKKIISVQSPIGTILAPQVFSTDDQATSAALAMYTKMINTSFGFSSSGMTIFGGLSADEFFMFNQTNTNYIPFQQNKLLANNVIVLNDFWTNAYSVIYDANALIEGLASYSGVHDSVKNELIGEAEFTRAFCNFYLTNLFGDIPLVNTINYTKTSLLSRSPQAQVYESIIADLKDAQNRLAADYSVGNGNRIIPNKWAATALLARAYLYTKDWADAEIQSTSVINNVSLFSLTDLNTVFLANSMEAIWQLQQSNNTTTSYNATPEGFLFIPRILNSNTYAPFLYLTNELINTFEANDQRRLDWIDSTLYKGKNYHIPYKYKQGPAQATPNGSYIEYYMVLRLGEQYLIRAEARAQQSESGAFTDLNAIRERAGLSDYTGTQDSLLTVIYHERQVEFFAEWGNRWLDLKRWGNAATTLSTTKGINVSTNALLFPIPTTELTFDPNLTPNPGY